MITFYQGALLGLLLVGLVAASVFLVSHRPRQWRRLAAWDASGWVLLVALFYVRQTVLILLRWPGGAPPGVGDAVFSLGTLALIDVLLILRMLSFRSFADRERERAAQS